LEVLATLLTPGNRIIFETLTGPQVFLDNQRKNKIFWIDV